MKKTKTKVPHVAVCHVRTHYNFGADAIIALTESMRQDIIRSGHAAHTVFTVPNMISLPDSIVFRPPKQTEVPVIGVCARLVLKKGVDIFIDALAELKKRNIQFKAQIAGDGKEKANCMKLIQRHQLQACIEMLGWLEDRDSFYAGLDLFCLPSRDETFGLVILEGMRHSLPMVLTNLSGPEAIVADTQSAWMVPPNDPVKLADGLARVMKDKKLAKQLALNGFNRVQTYDSHRVGVVLHQALETIACRSSIW